MNVLMEAERLIHSDRPAKYGAVGESFARIARAFNSFRPGAPEFGAEDVALLLVCMKLVRSGYSPESLDHLVDAAGYIGLLADIWQSRQPQAK